MKRFGWGLGAFGLTLLVASQGLAQAPGPSDAPPGSVTVPSEGGSVVVTPGSTSTTTTYQPMGVPAPGTDINAGLPSSSRPVTGDQSDTFDLNTGSGGGTVFGGKGAEAILPSDRARASRIPDIHVVKRGDTLWDLCDHYYGNPWQWPRVWSYNSQVANPHWIYPGDQIRMRDSRGGGAWGAGAGGAGTGGAGTGIGSDGGLGAAGFQRAGGPGGPGRLGRGAVFLRDQGFIGDPDKDVWGQVAGAVEEQMLLAQGNHVYLLLKQGAPAPRTGQELTIFRTVRQPDPVKGARKPPGEIVAVLGTVRIESYEPKTRVARATITESLDVIERGAKVGPVRRRFDVVPPVASKANVEARILTSLYPHVYLAQNQVVFLDRGAEDGLVPGNRLYVTRRGDRWRESLTTRATRERVRVDSAGDADVDMTPLPGDPKDFPEESIAELVILRAEKYSSIALVTQSRQEVVPGDVAVSRVGR
jgi:hypothetical protein